MKSVTKNGSNNDGKRFLSDLPVVMGILNVTPDSFYASSRCLKADTLRERALHMASEGAGILDLGACSTRPGSTPVPEDEERKRLLTALGIVREVLPDMPLSVDTFRRSVAAECVQECGPLLINDVSGGEASLPSMPYVLTCPTDDPVTWFAAHIPQLLAAGVDDLYLDPGFGFGKTIDDNYRILAQLETLQQFGYPLLVGLSRKSMIYGPLAVMPEDALPGTVALNTVALQKGASILRVHDVLPAVQSITLLRRLDIVPIPSLK